MKRDQLWCARCDRLLPVGAFTSLQDRYCRGCMELSFTYPLPGWREEMTDDAVADILGQVSRPSLLIAASEMKARLSRLQDGECAICDERGALVIDHDHHSGEVRGLLCHRCNVWLVRDFTTADAEAVARVARYLSNPPARHLHLQYRDIRRGPGKSRGLRSR